MLLSLHNDEDFHLFTSTLEDFWQNPTQMECGGRIFCIEGNATLNMNDCNYFLVKNASLAILMHGIIAIKDRSANFKAFVFIYTPDFFQIASTGLQGILPYYIQHPYIIRNDRDSAWILSALFMLQELSQHRELHYRIEMAQCILRYFLMGICNYAISHEQNGASSKFHSDDYFHRFIYLLSEHYKTDRSVKYYASLLLITTKHLNCICKRITNTTSKEVINQYVITQLKNEIRTSNKTILEIADEFNFPNQSFLCRYFKIHVHYTPAQFRKNQTTLVSV